MALTNGDELPINPNVQRYGIGVSWDESAVAVDIDLQAVIVDTNGTIIDAVYYNNLKALKSITHSGDEQTGEKAGLDEVIWVSMKKLPPQVRLIIFVIAAYSRGHLKDAENGMFHVLEDQKDNEVGRFKMEQTAQEVDAVAMLVQDGGEWKLQIIDEPATDGKHFIDILEPTLGNLIRRVIPGAPKRQKVAFAMQKGAVVDLPTSANVQRISAGLGWDVAGSGKQDIDLDVSCVFFSKAGKDLGAVFFGNTEEFGVTHSGDNLTGEGAGDDEVIDVNLEAIPQEVEQMFFCVNMYSKGMTFECVSNAYCRISDQNGAEMARYILQEGLGQMGLIIARLFREPGGLRWGFQALGSFCGGQTWKDSVKDMHALFNKAPRELQLRGMSTISLSAPAGAAPPPLGTAQTAVTAGPPPPTAVQPACCALQ